MLPDRINLIFLSATTPNTIEFSDWIGRTKRRKVHVISTYKRPVPLQHFMLYDDEIYKLMHAEAGFNSLSLQAAVKYQKEKLKPKVKSAENQTMAMGRANEKLNNAAKNAGVNPSKLAIKEKPVAKNTGIAGGKIGDVSGSKTQWLNLLKLLQNGGRDEAGGLKEVDFGVGVNKSISR